MKKKVLLSCLALLGLILVGSILIAISSADDEKLKQALREAGIEDIAQEVYTDRAISRGEVVTANDVYEIQIPVDEVRAEAFLCKDDAIGKRTVGAMEGGQSLTIQDLGLRKEEVLKSEIAKLKNQGKVKNAYCLHSADTKIRIPEKDVYKVTRGIPEGERIQASDIEKASVKDEDAKNCIGDIRLILNHMLGYGMEEGQPMRSVDLVVVGKESEEDAFVATRDLKPGEVVKPEDVAKKHFEKEKCSVNAILDQSLIVGSSVLQPIAKDRVFRVVDLRPAISQ